VYKTVAYHRAADAIGRSPVEVARAYREGHPPEIPGVGRAIADKLAELSATGRLGYHERLLAEFPPTLLDLLRIPGLGPKTVRQLYTTFGIATLEALRSAAETGRLRGLRGLSARTEQLILEGIAGLESRERRLLLHEARAIVDELVTARPSPASGESCGGPFRQRRETVEPDLT
jgi:DNA polymerase (family 10)